MVKWISVAAADYFCDFYLYLTSLLSNYFYLSISINKALWSNRQGKQLLAYGTSTNVPSQHFNVRSTLKQRYGSTLK